MKHLTEDDLIERLYAEHEEIALDSHLKTCDECAREFAALQSDMNEIKFTKPPERDASFGHQVWAHIADSLPTCQAHKQRWFTKSLLASLGYAAACAVLLLCAFVGGRHWERRQSNSTAKHFAPAKPPSAVKSPQSVIVVVLSDHLDRSERLLVELKHADPDTAGIASPLKDEARSLLTENRICRQKVKLDDDPSLRKALDHLDRFLAEIADDRKPLNGETMNRLQKELNADGLLFEVRVLRSRQAQSTAETKGSTI